MTPTCQMTIHNYENAGRLLDAEFFSYGSGGYGTLQELMITLFHVRPFHQVHELWGSAVWPEREVLPEKEEHRIVLTHRLA